MLSDSDVDKLQASNRMMFHVIRGIIREKDPKVIAASIMAMREYDRISGTMEIIDRIMGNDYGQEVVDPDDGDDMPGSDPDGVGVLRPGV